MLPFPLGEFAPLYTAAARAGFTPAQVDEMETWQYAAAMGLTDAPEAAQSAMSEDELIAARIAYAKGKGPPPPGYEPSEAPREGVGTVTRMADRLSQAREG